MALGVAASEIAWDAVLSSVPDLPESTANPVPLDPGSLREAVGAFEFYGGGVLTLAAEADRLTATFSGNGRIYFDDGRRYSLIPVGRDRFLLEGPSRDLIQLERQGGRVTGLVLNPGPWSQRASRRE